MPIFQKNDFPGGLYFRGWRFRFCSIGSLGKDMDEQGVENVTVQKTFFKGTKNGFRIKSWARPSNGFVEGVRFINATIQNVQNPIVIDQNYCPHKLNCPRQVRKSHMNFFIL